MKQQQTIIRRSSLPSIVGISVATIDRLRAIGQFPAARKLGGQAVGFLRSEIEEWMATRPVARQ